MPPLLKLLRPKQWAKNLLLGAALLFTGKAAEAEAWAAIGWAFLSLCLVSSAVYVLNDFIDRDKDRVHPVKKNRPIASGAVSIPLALATGAICLLVGVGLAFWIHPAFFTGVIIYLAIQLLYNFRFKQVPLLDVFTLASGFVLRAALGAVPIGVVISGWLLFCTGSLALLLGFCKRRGEFVLVGEDAAATRPGLKMYSLPLLDSLVVFSAALAGLAYGVYAIQSTTALTHPALILTTPFVLYSIARYLFLALSENEGGEPETLLLSDPHILISVAGFIMAVSYALGGGELPFVGDPRMMPK